MMRIIGPVLTFVDRPWKVRLIQFLYLLYLQNDAVIDVSSRLPLRTWCVCTLLSDLQSLANGIITLLGFDTASSIALLAASAIAKRGSDGKPIPASHIVILPVYTTPFCINCVHLTFSADISYYSLQE